MKAPDKLYIICDAVNNRGMTVATEKPMFSDDLCYIHKDALLELLKELRDDAGSRDDQFEEGAIEEYDLYQNIIDRINSL